MDRDLSPEIAAPSRERPVAGLPDLLPSRRRALAAIRDAVRSGKGPVVLTGDPGVGKSTLLRMLESGRAAGDRWLTVEATPGVGIAGLYRRMAREFGLAPDGFDGATLMDALAERSLGGERSTLAIEEAHNLDADALEEVRVLTNRLGADDGFAAILLVGQTLLARSLARRACDALASRLAAHVHLRPIDADEAGLLLASVGAEGSYSEDLVDRLHIAGEGRPGRIVALAARPAHRPRLIDSADPDVDPSPYPPPQGGKAQSVPSPLRGGGPVGGGLERLENHNQRTSFPVPPRDEAPTPWDTPLIGPTRPPIRVEDGLIEVGWQPDSSPGPASLEAAEEGDGTDGERIDDHYAALQAWQEWARNQGRHPAEVPAVPRDRSDDPTPLAGRPNLWADEEQSFAPLGRMFTRIEQGTENEVD